MKNLSAKKMSAIITLHFIVLWIAGIINMVSVHIDWFFMTNLDPEARLDFAIFFGPIRAFAQIIIVPLCILGLIILGFEVLRRFITFITPKD